MDYKMGENEDQEEDDDEEWDDNGGPGGEKGICDSRRGNGYYGGR